MRLPMLICSFITSIDVELDVDVDSVVSASSATAVSIWAVGVAKADGVGEGKGCSGSEHFGLHIVECFVCLFKIIDCQNARA